MLTVDDEEHSTEGQDNGFEATAVTATPEDYKIDNTDKECRGNIDSNIESQSYVSVTQNEDDQSRDNQTIVAEKESFQKKMKETLLGLKKSFSEPFEGPYLFKFEPPSFYKKYQNFMTTIVTNPYFDRVILCVIMISSIMMAMSDYTHVTDDNELSADGSPINRIILQAEVIFTVVFSMEMIMKMTALGINGYFKDRWNWLDFVVVVFAILSLTVGLANVGYIKAFRVLRPLKSIKSFPVLASIVVVILKSLSQMRDISIVIIFLFLFFGIAGLQFFVGPYLHTRCRLTPFPVKNSWQEGDDANSFRCLNEPNYSYEGEDGNYYSKSGSPWHTPQPDCFWPIGEDDDRFCTLTGSGLHNCENSSPVRYCGSNYDAMGNARFDAATANEETFIESLAYGYINYDNLGNSFLAMILLISGNGWTDVMYFLMDAISTVGGAIYAVVIILVGAFFVLQLIIATLENSLVSMEALAKKEKEKQERKHSRKRMMERRGNSSEQETSGSDKTSEQDDSVVVHISQKKGYFTSIRRYVGIEEEKDYLEYVTTFLKEGYARTENQPHRKMCKSIVESKWFQAMVTLFILINTIIMAMDRYPIPNEQYYAIEAITYVLTLFFILELVMHMVGVGVYNYFSDGYQQVDFIIVVLSIVDLALSPTPRYFVMGGTDDDEIQEGGSLSALRSLRLLRFLRLFRSKTLKELLYKIGLVVVSLKSFVVLLFLYVFIMALVGISFFANRFRYDENGEPIKNPNSEEWINAPEQPRGNFDNFSHAVLLLFQFLTLDNWNVVMYDCNRSLGPAAMLYVLIVMVSGTFLLLNMFLAMLIHNFNSEVPSSNNSEIEDEKQEESSGSKGSLLNKVSELFLSIKMFHEDDNLSKKPTRNGMFNWCICYWDHGNTAKVAVNGDETYSSDIKDEKHSDENESGVDKSIFTEEKKNDENISKRSLVQTKEEVTVNEDPSKPFECGSLNVIFQNRWYLALKDSCIAINDNPWFEGLILLLIAVSSVVLVLDNPLNNDEGSLQKTLNIFDIVLTLLFVLEMTIKMIALTIRGYFNDSWNLLDFFVVVVSVLSVAGSLGDSNALDSLSPLRALRALRPIRLINRLPELKILVTALVISVPQVVQIGGIFILVYLIFAIFFTSFLKGQLRDCQGNGYTDVIGENEDMNNLLTYPKSWNDMTIEERSWFTDSSPVNPEDYTSCNTLDYPCCPKWADDVGLSSTPTSRVLCECWGQSWSPFTDFRFDNTLDSMITLFAMGTADNWSEIVYAVSDCNGIDMQPIVDNNYLWYYVFIIFMLIGSFLFVQLFVGVIVNSFEKSAEDIGSASFLTPEQKEWAMNKQIIISIAPKKIYTRPDGSAKFARLCYDICQAEWFDNLIMVVIVMQVAVLSSTFFGISDEGLYVLEILNFVLSAIFFFEMLIKLFGVGYNAYFDDNWNRMDFAIVIASLVGLLSFVMPKSGIREITNLLRIVRLFRLIRLFKGVQSMRKLMASIVLTLPGVGNITMLLLLVLYIFTIVGVGLFAKVGYYNTYGDQSDFRSFSMGLLSIFRYTTCENWSQVMYDLTKKPEYDGKPCVEDPQFNIEYCGFSRRSDCIPLNGCGTKAAIPFFILLVFVINFVFLSVFISVIISSYNDANEKSIRPEDFQKFAQDWGKFDETATCFIHVHQLYEFAKILEPPFKVALGKDLSFSRYAFTVRKIRLCKGLRVHFSDVMMCLSAHHYEQKRNFGEEFDLKHPEDNVTNIIGNGKNTFDENELFKNSFDSVDVVKSDKSEVVNFNEEEQGSLKKSKSLPFRRSSSIKRGGRRKSRVVDPSNMYLYMNPGWESTGPDDPTNIDKGGIFTVRHYLAVQVIEKVWLHHRDKL